MDTPLLPSPTPGRILLVTAPITALEPLFEMAARLALQGPLFVVDGGNTFQGYPLARALRRRVDDPTPILARITLSRVFTCYQMEALLCGASLAAPEAGSRPILVLDLLATFYDQGVRIADRRRLLALCLQRLCALSRSAPVIVWARQRSVIPAEAVNFLDAVRAAVHAAAGQVWAPHQLVQLAVYQPTLFSS